VIIYIVQYDTKTHFPNLKEEYGRASEYLRKLASLSGGRLFPVSTLSPLKQAFAKTADELRHQYTLCYYPGNLAGKDAYHNIRVTVDLPGISLRTRTGYQTAQGQSVR